MPDDVAEEAEMDDLAAVDFHPVAAADGLCYRDVLANTYFGYVTCMKLKRN